MKKLLVLSMVLMSFVSYSQDRVNRTKLSFQESSEILTSSVGWEYNEELGEWVDYPNVIDRDKKFKDQYKSLQGSYQMSQKGFKFNSLQVKTITYEGKKYYVLLHNKWSGRWKYPSIREDWMEYKQVDALIFDEKEYQNLINYNTVNFYIVLQYGLEFEDYNETKFLDLIQTELSRPKDYYERKYAYKYLMMISKTKDNNIRFLTPTISDLIVKYKTYDFTKMYFETDINNFSKLFLK